METLKKISELLSKKTSIFIILVALVTFFYRPLFGWVRGNVQSLILGFIMLTMGMTLTAKDFKILASRPFDILVGTCAQFIIMPSIAFLLVHIFNLPLGIGLGLLLVGCCPGGVSSNIMSYLCHGDLAYSVGMTTVNTLLSPVVTPALLLLLTGQDVNIDAKGMFLNILYVTLFPVCLGFVINEMFSKNETYKNAQSIFPGLSVLGLACIVGGVVSQCGDAFLNSGFLIFIAVFFHNALGYTFGYLVGFLMHFNKAKNRTISIEVGMQNAGLATNLASNHFVQYPEAAVVSAICCVWHSISGTILANLFVYFGDRKKKD